MSSMSPARPHALPSPRLPPTAIPNDPSRLLRTISECGPPSPAFHDTYLSSRAYVHGTTPQPGLSVSPGARTKAPQPGVEATHVEERSEEENGWRWMKWGQVHVGKQDLG